MDFGFDINQEFSLHLPIAPVVNVERLVSYLRCFVTKSRFEARIVLTLPLVDLVVDAIFSFVNKRCHFRDTFFNNSRIFLY